MASSMTANPPKAVLPELGAGLAAEPQPKAASFGDTRALFETHASFVMRTVRRLGVRASDAEDVTQEVFMIVHRRRADIVRT
jgi:RNA polymerase sigma-70 factor (ECF subfamily)